MSNILRLLKKLTKKNQLRICSTLLASSLISCAHQKLDGKPLESLCILDFEAKMCWTDKASHEGFDFVQMQERQKDCGGIAPCWNAIDDVDLSRIHKKLNSMDGD